jgi:predicted XRE-type DNA-binding protein
MSMIELPEDLMDESRRKRIEAAGWAVGSVADFLELTDDEAAFVDLKLALSDELRTRREQQGLSQTALARRIGSSQSRVAKMEASDPSVSVDLLIRGLFAAGAGRSDIASAIASKPAQRRRRSPTKRRSSSSS